jgi:hypothetical protein
MRSGSGSGGGGGGGGVQTLDGRSLTRLVVVHTHTT